MPKIVDHPDDYISTAITFHVSVRLKKAMQGRFAELELRQSEYLRRLIQRDLNEANNQ